MKELPRDPFALHARMMDALIGDILDRDATTFCRLDALREVSGLRVGDLASPTVTGGPDGPEPAAQSQPKALIDYRKEDKGG